MYETANYIEKNNHFSIITAELKATDQAPRTLEVNDADLS